VGLLSYLDLGVSVMICGVRVRQVTSMDAILALRRCLGQYCGII
jgi:hypothetical protein